MRDENQRAAVVSVQRQQEIDHLAAGSGVEIAGRLVGEQDRWTTSECAGDRDSLLFSSRQLHRIVRLPVFQSYGRQQVDRTGLGMPLAGKLQGNGHIFPGCERRNKMERLKNV